MFFEWSKVLILNPIEHLWWDLKIAVHRRSPSNLAELEQFSHEQWARISPSDCAKLVETYPKRLVTVIAEKSASTKSCLKGLNTFTTSEFWFVHVFFQVLLTCNLLQLKQYFVWSLQLWIKKFIWKNCFDIIHNSSECGISTLYRVWFQWMYGLVGGEYFRKPLYIFCLCLCLSVCLSQVELTGE